ncbi:MAG: 3-phosphoglycerate dehydrogenase [Oscillospiraceae bacterium]|nr:3-phosphoglycerate dehydrogenase [Oscillospiraceae bacterium]
MFNIKTLNNIAQVGLDVLDTDKYAIDSGAEQTDAILVRSADMHDYDMGGSLKCIARAGTGVNNIPIDKCSEQGIVVFNTPGANSSAVKELTLCALLLSSRDIVGGIEWVKSLYGSGDNIADAVEKGKKAFVGPEIKGKTLGVIGLGAVGGRIANAAIELGMKVYGYDPYLSVDGAWNLSSSIIHANELDTIFSSSDYITIHVPYVPATHHLINADALGKMKQDIRLLNFSRAELVDDDAMIEAIDKGKVACYVTDFPNEKLVGIPHVIAIPHLGASTPESEDNCAIMAARQIADYLENGNIVNSVNFAKAYMPRTGDPRVCIIHKNIPDMIARITGVLSSKGVNIENMVNAGMKKLADAYTMIDMDSPHPELISELESIEGVLRVRVLD